MPLNFHISYRDAKYKNPVVALYKKIRANKSSKIKHIVTAENIIFKEDSEYANLIVQINQQKVLQSELYTQIYALLDQYKTSVGYTSILEEQCKNYYRTCDESVKSFESQITLRPFYQRILDKIYNCFDPSTKSWITVFQGL
jgi:hypothetical protein